MTNDSSANLPGYAPLPASATALPDYLIDAWQRGITFLDVLRQRGNQHFEQAAKTAPNVLTFAAEIVMDARTFERPVNYALARIQSPPGTAIDEKKRPFIVFDPRAGHGPGIGGMKQDSEIGIALKEGHPCYFVGFLPTPCPGQTIEDVCRAEARFVEAVIARHPAAEGKPCLIGNCQAGWQIMMMCAIRPDLPGPIVLAGAPLSYWAGVHGRAPMRYLGGLFGGSWLTSLTGDLGGGIFDGANLIANFEAMHLSNTYWKKAYDVYDNEAEAARFLPFERYWGSPVLLNAEEMEFIVDNLFVGNKLSVGGIRTSDGVRVDLRNITSSILVFCSWGDDITPPPQALDWVLDLYADESEIVRAGQTIIYCIHQTIGHLGIFVSGKVAIKEHAEFISTMDMIDMMPPGLYEAVITDVDATTAHPELLKTPYVLSLQARSLDDIRALGKNSEADEARFAAVARVSEINQGFYRDFLRGLVRGITTPQSAEALRRMHPHRLRFEIFSDRNPFMAPVGDLASTVHETRRPAAPDNPFRRMEHENAAMIVNWLDNVTAWRDTCIETWFHGFYSSPLLQAALGMAGGAVPVRQAERDLARDANAAQALARVETGLSAGGIVEASIRALLYVVWPERKVDERGFALLLRLRQQIQPQFRIGPGRFKEIVRQQFLALYFDEARAIKTLPDLLPEDRKQRLLALNLIRELLQVQGTVPPEAQVRLHEIEAMFEAAPPAPTQRKAREVQEA
jgi:hypothetical protein